MGIRDRVGVKADQARDAARAKADLAKDAALAKGGQAREAARGKADQAKGVATARAEQAKGAAAVRAGQAKDAAVSRARESVASRVESSAIGRLLGMDDDRNVTIERLTILLVVAVTQDEGRELTDRDVLAAARRRYRRLGTVSLPSGPVGGALVNLYCEAATLCDLVELRGRPLSHEAVAAHLLVLWRIVPDVQAAADAISGRGPAAASIIAGRIKARADAIELPDPMTKRAAILTLWRLRGVADELAGVEGTGIRERLFPGRRVKAFVKEASAQLAGPGPMFPAPAAADGPPPSLQG